MIVLSLHFSRSRDVRQAAFAFKRDPAPNPIGRQAPESFKPSPSQTCLGLRRPIQAVKRGQSGRTVLFNMTLLYSTTLLYSYSTLQSNQTIKREYEKEDSYQIN